jgi:hypothetical protein
MKFFENNKDQTLLSITGRRVWFLKLLEMVLPFKSL